MSADQRPEQAGARSEQRGGAEERLGRRDVTLTQLEGLRAARRRLSGGAVADRRRACVHLRTVRGV